MNAVTSDHLLTIPETCRRLSVGRTTVYRIICEGALPASQIGRAVRVRQDALETFLRRVEVPAASSNGHDATERGGSTAPCPRRSERPTYQYSTRSR